MDGYDMQRGGGSALGTYVETTSYPSDRDYKIASYSHHKAAYNTHLGTEEDTNMEDETITPRECTALISAKVATARLGLQQQLAGNENGPAASILGLTVDLSYQRIGTLQDDAVRHLRKDVDRLNLSHNMIFSLPPKFTECTPLTYLSLKDNDFKEFPRALFALPSLQVLDLSKNKIRMIPEEVKNMKALRLISFYHNKIRTVPLKLGYSEHLKVMKLGNNPLEEGLKAILSSTAETGSSKDAEDEKMTQLTARIKDYLKAEALRLGLAEDSSGESPVETPKPYHRKTSSRLPVNPASGSESNAEPWSPSFIKGSISSRSHSRMSSNQSNAYLNHSLRRPGASPVVIGNERYRSNSESLLQTTHSTRVKRMGMVPTRKTPDLKTVDEDKSNRNSFHLRGVSHASGLRENRANGTGSRLRNGASQPGSPVDQANSNGRFLRPLSSLPARRSRQDLESSVSSGTKEVYTRSFLSGAKKFIYSMHQVHTQLYDALFAIQGGPNKRSSIERIYENASNHLAGLDLDLRMYDREPKRDVETVQQLITKVHETTHACIASYRQICALLTGNAPRLLMQGDRDYIRTLLLLAFGSIRTVKSGGLKILLRNNRVASQTSSRTVSRPSTSTENYASMTLRPRPSQIPPSLSSSRRPSGRAPPPPFPARRQRSDTAASNSSRNGGYPRSVPPTPQSAVHLGSIGKAGIDSTGEGNALRLPNGGLTSTVTPHSGESFLIPETPAMPHLDHVTLQSYYREEERDALFEKIYAEFRRAAESGLEILPLLRQRFVSSLRDAQAHYANRSIIACWNEIIMQTATYYEVCESVKTRLQTIRLNDMSVRSSSDFWSALVRLSIEHSRLLDMLKVAKQQNMLGRDTSSSVQPLHVRVKAAVASIKNSPWSVVLPRGPGYPSLGSFVGEAPSRSNRSNGYASATAQARMNGHIPDPNRHHRTRGSSGSGNSPYPPTTPLSAALGPAAQATMPSTPQLTASVPQSGSHNPNSSVSTTASTTSATASMTSNAQPMSILDRSFQGDFFQRADNFLSMRSTHSSRR